MFSDGILLCSSCSAQLFLLSDINIVFNFYQIDGQDGGYEHSISSANEVSVEIVLYISV